MRGNSFGDFGSDDKFSDSISASVKLATEDVIQDLKLASESELLDSEARMQKAADEAVTKALAQRADEITKTGVEPPSNLIATDPFPESSENITQPATSKIPLVLGGAAALAALVYLFKGE